MSRRAQKHTVLHRLYHDHPAHGLEYLQLQWHYAVEKTSMSDPNARWIREVQMCPTIYRNSEEFDPGCTPTFEIEDMEKYQCWEHTGTLQNNYPVVSVRTSWNNSAKLELHRLAVLSKQWFSPNILSKGMTASHLCHNSKCIKPSHLCCESITYNSHRNTCRAWCIVDGDLYNQCLHEPQCLFSGNHIRPPQ